jgi:hypothetical protein
MIRIPYTLKEGQYDELLMNALGDVKKRKINFINYPKRQTPKEPESQFKVKTNRPIQKINRMTESNLSLIGTLKEII